MSERLSVKEAAEQLGLSPKSVYDLISAGAIPCRRIGLKGGKIILDRCDVDTYWASCKGVAKVASPSSTLRHIRPQSPFRRPS